MAVKQMNTFDTASALEQCANYYRHSRLYTDLFNTDDAYERYMQEYAEDTRMIIEQGFCYKLGDEYLLALDLEQFEKECPSCFHHYFDCIYNYVEPFIKREPGDVIFICAVGPSKDHFTPSTYKLINKFVSLWSDTTIFTDCPVEIDINNFESKTGSQKVIIAGREYFRWVT